MAEDDKKTLSQNEIEQLLGAISKGEISGEEGNLQQQYQQPKIKIYDFKRPDKFTREQIKSISLIHESFSQNAAAALSAELRSPTHLNVASVDQLTYEELMRAVPNPTTLAVLDMPPLRGRALLEIDPSLTFSIIDRLTGGQGDSSKVSRGLTALEKPIISQTVRELMRHLRTAWSTILDLRPSVLSLENNPLLITIVPPKEMVTLITFEMKIGEVEGLMILCLPFLTIEPVIPKLSARYWYSGKGRDGAAPRGFEVDLERFDFQVDTATYIETVPKTLQELQHLKPGDRLECSAAAADGTVLYLETGGDKVLKLGLADISDTEAAVSRMDKYAGIPVKPSPAAAAEALEERMERRFDALEKLIAESPGPGALMPVRGEEGARDRRVPAGAAQPRHFFSFLRDIPPEIILNAVRAELPQMIALVLSYLEEEKGAVILASLPHEIQAEVAGRIALMDRVPVHILEAVEGALAAMLSVSSGEHLSVSGGVKFLSVLLKQTDRATEHAVIEALETEDPELAEAVKEQMFRFEDIVYLENRAVQKVLREVDSVYLAKALKAAPPEAVDTVFRNMSKQAAVTLKEDMEYMGPVRLTDVEDAQKRIVAVIRKLEEQGDIVIGGFEDGGV
jgi:flagellar motor switch protein FliM